MAVSVSDICDNTKLAREMSLLGNYETASVYYQETMPSFYRVWVMSWSTILDPPPKANVGFFLLDELKTNSKMPNKIGIFFFFLKLFACPIRRK